MQSLKLLHFPGRRGAKHSTAIKLLTLVIFIFLWARTHWLSFFCCVLLVYLLAKKNVTFSVSFTNDFITAITGKPTTKTPSTAQQKLQLVYVDRFAKVAQVEMEKFGIPASITLAQGLLESQSGKSPLATNNNNHFGIKCFSRNCKKGHCSNFTDDSHKDFFRIYPTAWESYRAHSLFLQSDRYKHLKEESDYKVWAKGLQKAGYATDKNYADKLIGLISDLELDRYDKM